MAYSDKNISNFEYGCNFYEKEFSDNELWEYLQNGTDLEKQLAILRINSLISDMQARILMNNLVGVDGKIREAVSVKLNAFLKNPKTAGYFLKKEFYPVFLNAIIDINGNICRNVIDGLKNIAENKDFKDFMITEIFKRALETCKKIKEFDYKTRKYVTNKELFKLYWYLTALVIFNDLPSEDFKLLTDEVCNIEEYTVREKLAVLISKFPQQEQKQLAEKLNFDNNIYVSKALNIT